MSGFTIREAVRVVVYPDPKHGFLMALFGHGAEEELKALKLEQDTGGVAITIGSARYLLVTTRSPDEQA